MSHTDFFTFLSYIEIHVYSQTYELVITILSCVALPYAATICGNLLMSSSLYPYILVMLSVNRECEKCGYDKHIDDKHLYNKFG